MLFSFNFELQLKSFLDSDYRSCMYLDISLVEWKAKKQVIISLSSVEVEYHALATANCKIQLL